MMKCYSVNFRATAKQTINVGMLISDSDIAERLAATQGTEAIVIEVDEAENHDLIEAFKDERAWAERCGLLNNPPRWEPVR